jgi:hypothetical protein
LLIALADLTALEEWTSEHVAVWLKSRDCPDLWIELLVGLGLDGSQLLSLSDWRQSLDAKALSNAIAARQQRFFWQWLELQAGLLLQECDRAQAGELWLVPPLADELAC